MLKTKQVGSYTVSQIGALQGANLRVFQRRVIELTSQNSDEAYAETLQEWALIAACVSPYIPLEQWLDTPLLELRPLVDAVNELNDDVRDDDPTPKKKPSKAAKSNSA